MKTTAFLAVLTLAMGQARLESSSEVAGNDARRESPAERIIIPFTAEYDNNIGGHFTCVGFRISFSNKLLRRDNEECTCTDLSSFPPGTYTGSPFFYVNGTSYTWSSDYDGVQAHRVQLIVTDNGDGTGEVDVKASLDRESTLP